MKPVIYILCNSDHRRLTYVCDFIFGQMAGRQWELITDDRDIPEGECLISYGRQTSLTHLFIQPYGLLEPGTMMSDPFPNFDLNSRDVSFDYFSFVFFHLTRMEEYEATVDEHGRFQFAGSWADRHELANQPVVDLVLDKLLARINDVFGDGFISRQSAYHPVMSVDVDQLYSYKRKGWLRSIGGLAKDVWTLRFRRIGERVGALMNKIPDPYDTIPWMVELSRQRGVDTVLFFLVRGDSPYDKQIALKGTDFQAFRDKVDIGLHPSYTASTSENLIRSEKDALKELTGSSISRSRFHFLRMKLPHAYLKLMRTGLTSDYSLAWPDHIGFRAGTCHPFYFYNLVTEAETILKVQPTVAMDVVLKDKLRLTAEEAVHSVDMIVNACRKVRGPCVILWHNSSFDTTESWSGWKEVFMTILNKMAVE